MTVAVNQSASLPFGIKLDKDGKVERINDVAPFSSFCKRDRICLVNGIEIENNDQMHNVLEMIPQTAEAVVFSVERGELLLDL